MRRDIKIGRGHEVIKNLKQYKKGTSDLIVVEDITIIEEILKDAIKIKMLIYASDVSYQEKTAKMLEELLSESEEVYSISKKTYDEISEKDNGVGIIVLIEAVKYGIDDFKMKEFLLVMDHLELPGNIGTLYRTADAAGVNGIISVDEICKTYGTKVTQAARGMNLFLPSIAMTFQEAIRYLLENNYTIYLGEPNLGSSYDEYQYQGKIAIVIGNERFGINPLWYQYKAEKVFIPMQGKMNSLNVSVAGSVLLYEAAAKRKRRKICN